MKFWNNLAKKLIFIICITVIPINILAVSVSSIIIMEARTKIITSRENEFDMYMERKMSLIHKLDEWYMGFLADNLHTMTAAGSHNSVASINMAKELGDVLNVYGIQGFAFLWERQEACRLYLKGFKELYSQKESDGLKEGLRDLQWFEEPNGNWHIVEMYDNYYYFRGFLYLNYYVGFVIDLKAEMQAWKESGNLEGSRIVLTDGAVTLAMSGNGEMTELSQQEREEYLSPKFARNIKLFHDGLTKDGMDSYLVSEGFWRYVPAFYWILQIFAILSIFMLFALWRMIRMQVIQPLGILQEGMKELEKNELHYRIEEKAGTQDFTYIFDAFNEMADDILELHEKDILLYQTEITNLRLQVNPHMLLNSFNMIYSLAQTRNFKCIQEYSMHLVEYFRYVLKENDSLVPLESEMRFIENYIEIQKIRYPGEVTSVYTMQEGVEKALVPPLLIQNFVENAMKYARVPEKVVEVLINIRKEEGRLLISICDTGMGMDDAILEYLNRGEMYIDKNGQKHIGIWNCRRRIEAFFKEEGIIKITSTRGNGTQVWMELPYMEKMDVGVLGSLGKPLARNIP